MIEIFIITYILSFIALGFAQPIAALLRIIVAPRQSSSYAIGLKRYLLGVAIYFMILALLLSFDTYGAINGLLFFYLFILPWAYIIWYTHHIRYWSKKRKNIVAFDQEYCLKGQSQELTLLHTYPTKKIKICSIGRQATSSALTTSLAKLQFHTPAISQ